MKQALRRLFGAALLALVGVVGVSAQKVEDGKLISWGGASGNIKIPDGVTEIAENCFYTPGEDGEDGWTTTDPVSNTEITGVDFNNVRVIGKNAFKGCTGLASFTAPKVGTVNEEAFEGCNALKTIALPAVKSIAKNAFANCEQLTTAKLGAPLQTVGVNPFANCAALQEILVDDAATAFRSDDGALLRLADGVLVSMPGAKTEYESSDDCKKLGEASLKACRRLTRLSLPFVTEIGNGALSGCSSLTELLVPRLQKVDNSGYLTFNAVGSLKVVDVHLNPTFAGFGGALSAKETTVIYVANESVKAALANEVKKAKIVVGAPAAAKQVKIAYRTAGGGNIEAWTTGANDVPNGATVAAGVKLTFKAVPLFDHEVERWVCNGKDVTAQAQKNILVLEQVQDDIDLTITFRQLSSGAYVFFRSVSPAMGSLICTRADGSQIHSADKVTAGDLLTFKAVPRRGYRITNWQREKKNVPDREFENLPQYYAQAQITIPAEDALDIQVDFERQQGYYIVKFASFNTANGTLTARNATDNTDLESGFALPANSKIVFTAHPAANCKVDEWQLNGTTLAGYQQTTYTIKSLSEDVEVNMVCAPGSTPQKGDWVIRNGHLISWKPVGAAVLPAEVTHIDAGAFEGAVSMTSLTLNDKVQAVTMPAFLYCVALTDIQVPAANAHFTSVDGVLYNKARTRLVAYPAGKRATAYQIPVTVTSVQPGCFAAVPALSALTVEEGNTAFKAIDGGLYDSAGQILYFLPAKPQEEKAKNITLKEGLQTIAPFAITYHPHLEKLTLPASLVEIQENALCYNPKLVAFTFPDDVTPQLRTIGEDAFYYCRTLSALPYLPHLSAIGKRAFSTCTLMETAHLPEGCRIGIDAFKNCVNLHAVYSYAAVPPLIAPNAFADIAFINEAKLYVPRGTAQAYETATGWNIFAGHIKEVLQTAIGSLRADDWQIQTTAQGFVLKGFPVGTPYALYTVGGALLSQGTCPSEVWQLSAPRGITFLKVAGYGTVKLSR